MRVTFSRVLLGPTARGHPWYIFRSEAPPNNDPSEDYRWPNGIGGGSTTTSTTTTTPQVRIEVKTQHWFFVTTNPKRQIRRGLVASFLPFVVTCLIFTCLYVRLYAGSCIRLHQSPRTLLSRTRGPRAAACSFFPRFLSAEKSGILEVPFPT